MFAHGTCVFVPNGLDEEQAFEFSKKRLAEFLKFHPDGTPFEMKDGNFLASAAQIDAFSVVLQTTLESQANNIKINHLKGLQGQPSHEVILTQNGPNVFDELGMRYLFARSFIFWDADELKPAHFVPAEVQE